MTSRRSAGLGAVDQLPSGKWRVRLPRDEYGRRQSKAFASEAEARSALNGAVAALAEAAAVPTGPVTLAEWGRRWLERRRTDGVHRGERVEGSLWRSHIALDPIAKLPVRDLTRRHIRDWLERTSKRPTKRRGKQFRGRCLSRTSLARVAEMLSSCLHAAVSEELLETNPCAGTTIPTTGPRTHDAWTFLTTEEIALVETAADVPLWARTIYVTAIYSGMRRGELWGLRWEDVRLDGPRPELTIRYSHGGPTKSGEPRTIPLLAPVIAALKAWVAVCPQSKEGYVFPSGRGKRRAVTDQGMWCPRSSGSGRTHRGYASLAGIKRPVRFHDLRHTCASHLVMGTWGTAWTLQQVAAYLGHSSTTITQRYAHLSQDHLHNVASVTHCAGSRPAVVIAKALETSAFMMSADVPDSGECVEPQRVETTNVLLGRDPGVTQAGAAFLARELLGLVTSGTPVPLETVHALAAAAVAETEIGRLAMRATAGGPTALRAAIELAGVVLLEGQARALPTTAKKSR